jgi:tetratricopeptide (TPR) repeat protein
VIAGIVFFAVDIKTATQRVRASRLNDALPEVGTLIQHKDDIALIPSEKMKKYRNYFSLVIRYIPEEPAAHLMAAVLDGAEESPETIKRHLALSVDRSPFLFWNVYDMALVSFKEGDLENARVWFERALSLSTPRVVSTISGAIIYRQMLVGVPLKEVVPQGLRQGRENARLFLTASAYRSGQYDVSQAMSLAAIEATDVVGKEPFFFYAGASLYAKGEKDKALALFLKAIQLKSRNPLVYALAGEILVEAGKTADGQHLIDLSRTLVPEVDPKFPYPDRLQLKFL